MTSVMEMLNSKKYYMHTVKLDSILFENEFDFNYSC